MFTKEEQLKLKDLMSSNEDFAYFINKSLNECKFLASNITHELRNPLTLIKSTAQLMETDTPSIKDTKYWNQLVEDINELELLLAEFSTYNHSETIQKNPQNFLLLLKSVLSTFRPVADKKQINLSLTVDEKDVPLYTSYPVDQVKMRQVFVNLLQNALEATSKGGYIDINCTISDASLLISVNNNGEAIPEDILPTIFTPFISYKSGGSGLGLAISSNIIMAHDGTIKASSSEEQTSFIIQLPRIA
ncbi:MAG: hypothetical protein K0S61_3867 [Anaerocolumna sp.]|jgi:signal transduction histidine kinase|nr:hypothetical protein [Anaerocolumna sp.]